MTIKNGDMSAMPIICDGFGQFEPSVQAGLTKRETMAMHIMSAMLVGRSTVIHNTAKEAVYAADELLYALECRQNV